MAFLAEPKGIEKVKRQGGGRGLEENKYSTAPMEAATECGYCMN